MNTRSISICSLLVLTGCHDAPLPVVEEVKASPEKRLERLIEDSREVTFYGWNGMQHNGGAHFRLTFQKEGKVKLDTLGYNFVFAYGSYRLEKGALIKIAFTDIDAPESDRTGYTTDWPVLRLSELDGRFLIHRADGSAAWHLGWPLYPQVMGDLWPASTASEKADHDGADLPPAAPESKPEDNQQSKPESEESFGIRWKALDKILILEPPQNNLQDFRLNIQVIPQ